MKTLFTFHAFVTWLFGLALLLVPVTFLAAYGITADPGGAAMARLLGGAFIGLGVMGWLARAAAPSEALRAFILGIAVVATLGTLVSLHSVLSGASNGLGWLTVALYGIFAVGFGMLAAGKAPVHAHTV